MYTWMYAIELNLVQRKALSAKSVLFLDSFSVGFTAGYFASLDKPQIKLLQFFRPKH